MAGKKGGIRRFLTVSGIVLASLLILSSFAIYIAPQIGWRIDGLRSGSMAPQLNTGDLVVTRPAAPETVRVNDIIIFRSPDKRQNLISHRVTSIQANSPLTFQTKGDANERPDPFTVPAGNLVGKLAFHLPLLGYGVLFLQTKSGLFAALVIPGVYLTLWCIKNLANELAAKAKSKD